MKELSVRHCFCVRWYVRVSVRVRKGWPPSLLFRTAFGHCVSLSIVLSVMICVHASVCVCVRTLHACMVMITYVEEESVVRALHCVKVRECVR